MSMGKKTVQPSPGVLGLQIWAEAMISIAKMRKRTVEQTTNLTKAAVTQAIKAAVDAQREADAALLDEVAQHCIDLNQRAVATKMAKLFRGEIKLEDIVRPVDPNALILPAGG